jgi:hypothetical protein
MPGRRSNGDALSGCEDRTNDCAVLTGVPGPPAFGAYRDCSDVVHESGRGNAPRQKLRAQASWSCASRNASSSPRSEATRHHSPRAIAACASEPSRSRFCVLPRTEGSCESKAYCPSWSARRLRCRRIPPCCRRAGLTGGLQDGTRQKSARAAEGHLRGGCAYSTSRERPDSGRRV